ncbi:hypothetical protein GCWU000342_01496 [Shuttleworthella satelles DSM 14600]|uniref:Uncharacterized protein n=1 Tax=Shuttleworthella satelles DSM 14600 TaxID=626523 RepID=C4GC09_9FIRM|nr:hypothetical protein GCWU000342_01496 [Shuttleworthia satelles DSM 14600]
MKNSQKIPQTQYWIWSPKDPAPAFDIASEKNEFTQRRKPQATGT